jgi:hypothetical protein
VWSAIALYNLAEWLLESTEDAAKSALRRLQTIIVPMLNYDNYGITRKNANGVDLNRNFVSGWCAGSTDPSSDYYKGTAAGSEKETQYMRALFSKEKPKVYVNFHNFGGDPTTHGDIRSIGYADAQYTSKSNEILNKFLSICDSRSVDKPKTTTKFASPSGYAVNDCYALCGAYAFLWEVWYETPTLDDTNGLITNRIICFETAVDQLYGAEPVPVLPIDWSAVLPTIGVILGSAPLIYWTAKYGKDVIKEWKSR